MEKFSFEVPSISRKEDAINFIIEFIEYKSEIHGVGGLHKCLDSYEIWLKKLEEKIKEPAKGKVPELTYFFVRENDKKIIGMSNIRLSLNKELCNYGRAYWIWN